jgi:4-hydroxybenzoate polyprenyltransferase
LTDETRMGGISCGPPLVVAIEGTLVKTNMLHEKIMQFLARTPLAAWRLLLWFVQGRRTLERELDARVPLEINTTPLCEETLACVREAQSEGRPVYFASDLDRCLVQKLADVVGGVTGIFSTDTRSAAGSSSSADRLNAVLGSGRYDYIGNRPGDYALWRSARQVFAVSRSASFSRELYRNFPDARIIAEVRLRPRFYIQAVRPHQWAKNLLVFLPLVTGHDFSSDSIANTCIAFLCFCLAASSAYLFNDLMDLPGDRAHSRKRSRPFAAGNLPISHGVALSLMLMVVAVGASLLLTARFTIILMAYVALTMAYSFILKRKLLVDVIVLGGLYTIRVLGGIAAVASAYSYWLLMFCLFLFLSLATVKRCAELVAGAAAGRSVSVGRGYRAGDLAVLFPLAAAAGYGAVLVVALYLSSPEVVALYAHPLRLWLLCPLLLYWISRMLVLASRNELHHDPVTFALTDRISILTGVVAAAIIAAAI